MLYDRKSDKFKCIHCKMVSNDLRDYCTIISSWGKSYECSGINEDRCKDIRKYFKLMKKMEIVNRDANLLDWEKDDDMTLGEYFKKYYGITRKSIGNENRFEVYYKNCREYL